ncbi:MAG: FG-GAP-like repeat-containing protein [bacterium]
MLTHRNLGLAYLEDNKLREAAAEFQTLVEIAPQEPLGYANLGLACLRMHELEPAEKWLHEALQQEPDHLDICLLLAKVYELTDRENQAIRTLESSLKKHPNHVRTLYQLAQYYLNAQDVDLRQKAEDCLTQVVHALPANVAARLQLVELLLQNDKPGQALEHMETIRQTLPELPPGSEEIFQRSLELMRDASAEQALSPARTFHNLVKPASWYQGAIAELKGADPSSLGAPITRFSQEVSRHLQKETGVPAALTFTEVTNTSGLDIVLSDKASERGDEDPQIVMAQGDFDRDGDQDLYVSRWLSKERASRQYLFANTNGFFSDLAANAGIAHPGRDRSAIFADYDNDGYLDLFVTNTRSNRLYRNTGTGAFSDVTSGAGVKTDVEGHTALFADLDLEGDLDLFLATNSQNRLYRNNADGTFTEIAEEAGLGGGNVNAEDAAFGDFDDDGDLDLLVISPGGNRYYDNLRQSFFRDITGHSGLATAGASGAVTAGDYNNDGSLDLFVTDLTGGQHSLFRNQGDGTFERQAGSDSAFESIRKVAGRDAVFFDSDNDGFLDLLVAGTSQDTSSRFRGPWLFYNNGDGKYLEATSLLPLLPEAGSQVEVADYDNDGDLDIFVAGWHGAVHLLRNDGGNVNNYLIVRLAGLRTGSGKNNHFGIGSKVEVKAGDLHQTRLMSTPVAHFGLGHRDSAEVVRVVWSNGVAQNWFRPEKIQTITEDQILKGSCPWLYAWDGEAYEFVTDVLWASALGMPLGLAQAGGLRYAFPNSTDEYLKIPGAKLRPKNGRYSVQFTSELWETPFLDQVRLLVVDHPDSVDVFVDEKFTPPPFPEFRIYAVADQRLPVSACDDQGNDVLPAIAREDGKYVSNFTPAKYQGVTAPHDLVLDLGDLSQAGSVFLFLHGWVFPTDASINVNMAQSGAVKSIPPLLQVVDEKRDATVMLRHNGTNWKTVIENLGFPKGKNKTVVVDLSGKFLTADHRLRIRTSMQIYWDHVFYAIAVSGSSVRTVSLEPVAADLHYRGFSSVTRETPYSPHIPDYQTVTTAPNWRDLTGLYTRYGDVLPLLMQSDNKYVIMNAGDELSIEFDAAQAPELPSNWSRDFIFYNDGWLKDGDLNTAHGQTVEPLPFHGMSSYPYGPDESYPGDEEHVTYLRTYNTREVSTEAFKRLLFSVKTHVRTK